MANVIANESKELESNKDTVKDNTNLDYIDTIKKLKENSVSRDQYDKVVQENKKLLDSVINGSQDNEPVAKPKRTIEEIKQHIKIEGLSNLDYVKDSVDLRDALIEQGKPDPFLPLGAKYLPDDNDVASANRVAEVFKECIDYAQGDSDIFTNELMRRTIDVKIPSKNK